MLLFILEHKHWQHHNMNNKNNNLSSQDPAQIARYTYQENMDAQRVFLVGSDLAESVKEAVKEGLKEIKFDFPKQEQPLVIETEVIVKEPMVVQVERLIEVPIIKEIEKQIIVKETQIIEIEKPMIIIEPRIVEIERPIYIDRIKTEKIVPGWLNFLVICESIILFGILVSYLTKGH
jgi:hypothetical protein